MYRYIGVILIKGVELNRVNMVKKNHYYSNKALIQGGKGQLHVMTHEK